jgi:hypothetical protein
MIHWNSFLDDGLTDNNIRADLKQFSSIIEQINLYGIVCLPVPADPANARAKPDNSPGAETSWQVCVPRRQE